MPAVAIAMEVRTPLIEPDRSTAVPALLNATVTPTRSEATGAAGTATVKETVAVFDTPPAPTA